MDTGKVINKISNRLRRRSAALQEKLGIMSSGKCFTLYPDRWKETSVYQKGHRKEFGLRPSTATEALEKFRSKRVDLQDQ